jgi:hypothetical protein
MTKRAGKKFEADPSQWYIEPEFSDRQLFQNLDFGGSLIWDPSCGKGTVLDAAKARGYQTVGSDVVDRHPRHRFFRANFLTQTRFPKPEDRPLSIVCNPPYGTVDGVRFMANRFVKKALADVDFYRAAFLVPIEFNCGQERFFEIYSKRAPSHVLFCCQRPSMPPGTVLAEHGEAARGGGMADYCWIVWTRGGPYRTETIYMRPDVDDGPVRDRRKN